MPERRRSDATPRPRRRRRSGEADSRSPRQGRGRQGSQPLNGRQTWAFLASAGLAAWFALQEGGYDIVLRQESALVIWWALAVGYLLNLLPLSAPPRRSLIPLGLLGGLAAWTGLSLAWTASPERTWEELARLLNYAGVIALAWSCLGRRTWRAAAAGLAFVGLAICTLAIGSRLMPTSPFDPPTSEAFHQERLAYPLGYWNALGAWSAMSIALGLAWSAHASDRRARAIALAALPVAGSALYLSYSRGALVGVAIGIVVVIALGYERWIASLHALVALAATGLVVIAIRANPEIAEGSGTEGAAIVMAALVVAGPICGLVARGSARLRPPSLHIPPPLARRAIIACAVALLGLAVVLGPDAASDLGDSFDTEAPLRGDDPAERLGTLGGGRHELWSSALAAFEDRPAGGIGAGSFALWWSRDHTLLVRDAHSLYLEVLAELGVLGLLLLLGFVGACLSLAIRARRQLARTSDVGVAAGLIGVFAVFVVQAGVDWMWEVPAVTVLALLAIAIAIAAGDGRGRRRPGLSGRRRAAVVAVALAVGAVQVPGTVATERTRQSETALAIGDPELSQELADEAVLAQPWSASSYAQRARARAELGDLAGAREDLRIAVENEPTNWRFPLVLAVIEFEGGDAAAATDAYERARALRPVLPATAEPVLEALAEQRS